MVYLTNRVILYVVWHLVCSPRCDVVWYVARRVVCSVVLCNVVLCDVVWSGVVCGVVSCGLV